jgi:hypothetical protein
MIGQGFELGRMTSDVHGGEIHQRNLRHAMISRSRNTASSPANLASKFLVKLSRPFSKYLLRFPSFHGVTLCHNPWDTVESV